MDYEKYYDKRSNDCYIIHFPNNRGISVPELTQMFSKFGEVASINNRGQSHGLCFVKYKTLEAVKRSIDGFRNHQDIHILPHKNKNKTFSSNNKSKAKLPDGQSESTNKNKAQGHQSDTDVSDPALIKNIDTVDSDSTSNTSFNSIRNVYANHRSVKLTPHMKKIINVKRLQGALSSTSISSAGSNDNSTGLVQVMDNTEIPALVPSDHKNKMHNYKPDSTSYMIIPAHEVIVANIHPSLTIHYILHLFDKYNPVSVSPMKTTPTRGIKYCHVYYKTAEEAFMTMKTFDKYCLQGRNLIVSTLQNLIQEAHSAY